MSMVPSFKRISFSFNFSFYFKILVIVVGEKWVPCPKRVDEKWLPIQNSAVRGGYQTKTWLSEVVTWPKLVGEIWSPNQYASVRYGTLLIGQVTIFHRRVSVRWPLLTAVFWSGTHFWQPSFGSVTISHRHILDRVPIFHRRLLQGFWNEVENKAKGNSFEAWHHAHSVPGRFLRHICHDSSYWHHPFKAFKQKRKKNL